MRKGNQGLAINFPRPVEVKKLQNRRGDIYIGHNSLPPGGRGCQQALKTLAIDEDRHQQFALLPGQSPVRLQAHYQQEITCFVQPEQLPQETVQLNQGLAAKGLPLVCHHQGEVILGPAGIPQVDDQQINILIIPDCGNKLPEVRLEAKGKFGIVR